ncbi:hypothetical protein [Saccharopolyspora thermophila]|nr:hypothetical protein [Saccharopolyspora subtropica]
MRMRRVALAGLAAAGIVLSGGAAAFADDEEGMPNLTLPGQESGSDSFQIPGLDQLGEQFNEQFGGVQGQPESNANSDESSPSQSSPDEDQESASPSNSSDED